MKNCFLHVKMNVNNSVLSGEMKKTFLTIHLFIDISFVIERIFVQKNGSNQQLKRNTQTIQNHIPNGDLFTWDVFGMAHCAMPKTTLTRKANENRMRPYLSPHPKQSYQAY